MIKNNNSVTVRISKHIFLMLGILSCIPAFAAQLYTIEPYIDFSTQGIKKAEWLAPVANSTKDNELFFINTQGEVYRSVGQQIEDSPLLNLSEKIQTLSQVTFTAFVLHPSFHLIDQNGSNIIYSAHIETYDENVKNVRLYDNEIKEKHTHDAVIIEWQLSNINNHQVNVIAQREVMRIATASPDTKINQLSFNPYLKPWSDDFGLLYIVFTHDEEIEHSTLYSGSVLRIKPEKFGLKSYTIPRNNPFIKSASIAEEVVIVGAQNINQLTWSKQTKNQLILTHEYENEQLITLTPIGSNYLQTKPINTLYKGEIKEVPLSTVYYKSRELMTLWNKILFLDNQDKQWTLKASKIKNTLKNPLDNEPSFATEIKFNPQEIIASNKILLFIPRENELLLWDQSQNIIYKILPQLLVSDDVISNEATSEQTSSDNSFSYIVLLLFVIAIFLFIKIKYNQTFLKTKSLLRANLARFTFDPTTNEISLYRRHETEVDIAIPIQNLMKSEILLNDTLLNTVSGNSGEGFDEQKENALRLSFEQEHRDKMVDDKVRKITLKLSTIKAEEHLICVYLREGNQRLTKAKYYDVIDYLIDWNWYFSSQVNRTETPKRVIKEAVVTKVQKSKTAPSHSTLTTKSNQEVHDNNETNNINTKENNTSALTSSAAKKQSTTKVDTKLIDALNKLVTLKEQGYLTEEEFALAKQNLLENLSDKTKK